MITFGGTTGRNELFTLIADLFKDCDVVFPLAAEIFRGDNAALFAAKNFICL